MKLRLIRRWFTDKSTIGELMLDGVTFCYTLEDKVREVAGEPVATWKIAKATAIPVGTYEVEVTLSARFKRRLPLLLDVPGFVGVRIHPGNTDKDTEGCILVGESRGQDSISDSRLAFARLFTHLDDARERKDTVYLTIEGLPTKEATHELPQEAG